MSHLESHNDGGEVPQGCGAAHPGPHRGSAGLSTRGGSRSGTGRHRDAHRDQCARDAHSGAAAVDLAAAGYTETEYYASGTANRYDGTSAVTPTATVLDSGHPYTTRVVVSTPSPEKFNGTLVVEWNNVTIGVDGEFVFAESNEYLLREGYAVAAVSAQRADPEPQDLGADPVRLAERRCERLRKRRNIAVHRRPAVMGHLHPGREGCRGQQWRCARRVGCGECHRHRPVAVCQPSVELLQHDPADLRLLRRLRLPRSALAFATTSPRRP